MEKIYEVAILGVGARGGDTYGRLINTHAKDKFKIVALCDMRKERLQRFATEFGVDSSACFTDEEEFFKQKRADVLIIATQDQDHYAHAMKAFECGYDIMLEKPITDNREECENLLSAQKKYGKKALVCHVLRYAPAFLKAKELLDAGSIGRLVAVTMLEQVAYWHQAHSYVRGNWRNQNVTAPMILAKSCHDLDLLQYYAGAKCRSVSSVGDLAYFNSQNAPEGAANRCTECKYINDCPYSAKRIYVDRWLKVKNEDIWPYNILVEPPITKEKLEKAIKDGQYGRYVFACDNNVVDHQITQMTFENGVKATLTMTGFTANSGRKIIFHGTTGELELNEEVDSLFVKKYGAEQVKVDFNIDNHQGYGHGGGDYYLIKNLYDMIEGRASSVTSLDASIESHLMGISAEESRLNGGKLINVHKSL